MSKKDKKSDNDFRSQLKATKIKSLRKRIDADDAMVGSNSNEYLNLEDGKTIKIRIFPAHPGGEDFYIPVKRYWLSFMTDDGETKRGYVFDSRTHGGTKMDVVDEYVKYAKRKVGNDDDKLEALVGTGPKANSLNPSYSWMCYAAKISGDEPLRAKLWEFKKTVRDLLNKLAMSEDDDEPIEVDPFTDPDEGLPISVTYNKNPNRKKGEQYYDVVFPKKVSARPLTDEEIEYFMTLKPLSEIISRYTLRDFEKAMEGLQNFDEDNDIGLFDDEEWLEHLEEIKAQYDSEDEDEEKSKNEKSRHKVKKVEKVEEEEEDDEDDEEETESEDEFDEMDRDALKKYVKKNKLDIQIKKSMSDDEIREAIREALNSEDEEEPDSDDDEEEDDEPKKKKSNDSDDDDDDDDDKGGKVTLEQIRAKLSGKK